MGTKAKGASLATGLVIASSWLAYCFWEKEPVRDSPLPASHPQPNHSETVEFSQGERWTEELRLGREVIFDGLLVAEKQPSGSSAVSTKNVSVQSLGPLPPEGNKLLTGVIGSSLVSEELTLTEPPPVPTADRTVHAAFAMRSAEAGVAHIRFSVLKEMMADRAYITVPAGTNIPCPSGFTRTVYSGFAMADGRSVDVVFLVSHEKAPTISQAMGAYHAAAEAYIDAHLERFNTLTPGEKSLLLARNEEVRRKLSDRDLSQAERKQLTDEVFPDEVEVRDGIMKRTR